MLDTINPEFKLTMNIDGGILSKGIYNFGNTLTNSGSGIRMFWYPRKAAFRAGEASGDGWDDVNIAYGTVAFGYANRATGFQSSTFDIGTNYSADNSVTLGNHTNALAANAAAFGSNSTESGINSNKIKIFIE